MAGASSSAGHGPGEASSASGTTDATAARPRSGARLRAWAARLLRAPLTHFALAGALLLCVDRVRTPPRALGEGRRIVVTHQLVEDLRSDWARRRGRAPSREEESLEIDRYIEEEALFRAALGLGLQESDTIVRRRLVQRMRFLHEDLAAVREPSDDELSAYVTEHGARYAPPPRVTFEQVFFSRSARGAALAETAAAALAALRSGGAAASDPYPLPLRTVEQTQGELARALGPRLAEELFTLPEGAWRGPEESSFGLHLVRVRERHRGPVNAADVRARAREDWRGDRRQEVEQALVAALRQRFEIVREDAERAPL
jgi:hypothetical protein